jgi:hypothetical protein
MAQDQPPSHELEDKLLDAAVDAIPEGSRAKVVVGQAGWVALVLGWLVGNVPLSAMAAAVAKGKAGLAAACTGRSRTASRCAGGCRHAEPDIPGNARCRPCCAAPDVARSGHPVEPG